MKAYRDNIYEVLESHNQLIARQWRQSYQPLVPFATAAQEFRGLVDYFFAAFSSVPGNFTRELNCITGNSHNWNHWLSDFISVIAPSFINNARYIFAPKRGLADNVSELGSLLGAL